MFKKYPDLYFLARNFGANEATMEKQAASKAYHVLVDREKRSTYDAKYKARLEDRRKTW